MPCRLILGLLKVDGNETKNEGDREGDNKSASVWPCGDRGLFKKFERVISL